MKTVAVQLLARYNLRSAKLEEAAVFAWLVSQQYCSLILNQHQPPATSQSAILFSHNKSAPTTRHSQVNTVNMHIKPKTESKVQSTFTHNNVLCLAQLQH